MLSIIVPLFLTPPLSLISFFSLSSLLSLFVSQTQKERNHQRPPSKRKKDRERERERERESKKIVISERKRERLHQCFFPFASLNL
jgi:flagellar biosynthesis component FlhA